MADISLTAKWTVYCFPVSVVWIDVQKCEAEEVRQDIVMGQILF